MRLKSIFGTIFAGALGVVACGGPTDGDGEHAAEADALTARVPAALARLPLVDKEHGRWILHRKKSAPPRSVGNGRALDDYFARRGSGLPASADTGGVHAQPDGAGPATTYTFQVGAHYTGLFTPGYPGFASALPETTVQQQIAFPNDLPVPNLGGDPARGATPNQFTVAAGDTIGLLAPNGTRIFHMSGVETYNARSQLCQIVYSRFGDWWLTNCNNPQPSAGFALDVLTRLLADAAAQARRADPDSLRNVELGVIVAAAGIVVIGVVVTIATGGGDLVTVLPLIGVAAAAP